MHGLTRLARARRLAIASVIVSTTLAAANLVVGSLTQSTSVFALGFEFAGDVLASTMVLVGLLLASRPPDANHPYGHGRAESLAGLLVGVVLFLGGIGIGYRSLQSLSVLHAAPGDAAIWVLAGSIGMRATMSALKFRVGRRAGSTALVADAWNDAVDIFSAAAALAAVGLSRLDPGRFLAADHYGGFAIGLVVVITGVRVVRDASSDLADTMPAPELIAAVRRAALQVPGVRSTEPPRARKTGLQYHVDLHIAVDPAMSVLASHRIAHEVRQKILSELQWVADVLVHVEPDMTKPESTKA